MTKRAVWIVCLCVALLSLLSVAYRMMTPAQFDPAAWRAAEDASQYLDRRGMMGDVNKMFLEGRINSKESANSILGVPERTEGEDRNIWLYNLGGQRGSAAPESGNWLELAFDSAGRLTGHRIRQELVVPVPE